LYSPTDDAQAGEAQVLERARLADGVEERVQEQRDVRVQEQRARVRVRRHALQQRQGVGLSLPGCQIGYYWRQHTTGTYWLSSTGVLAAKERGGK
jgi:hypothetical protein